MTVVPIDYETILELVYQLPVRQRFTLVQDVLQSLEPSVVQRESPVTGASEISTNTKDMADEDETEWLYAAAQNPVFQFLNDPAEDIYAITDGEPLHGTEV